MNLDDLRSILLSERETGRLTSVAPDIFDKGHAELAAITKNVYAIEDPFSDEARSLIDETLSIRETLHDIYSLRTRKILALAVMHAEGNYYDREEVKRMIPAEKEMFEQMTASIEQCQGILLRNIPHTLNAPRHAVPVADDGMPEPELFEEGEPVEEPGALLAPANPLAHPCVLVHVL
jgi:DNA replication factor GINS